MKHLVEKSLLQTYIEDVTEDLKIDEMNVKEVALRLPGRKHFWVARLVIHKQEKLKLERDMLRLQKAVASQSNLPIAASEDTRMKIASAHEQVVKIKEQIQELDLLIEFLEKTERVFSNVTWDIRNIVKIQENEMM